MTIYLGQNIKYLRETKLKVTKIKFGELIDIKSSTIGKYEENTNRPSFEVLVKLQQLFEVNLHDLIFTNLESIKNDQTSEPEQSYHKINVLDELCELRKQVEEHQRQIDELRSDIDILKDKSL